MRGYACMCVQESTLLGVTVCEDSAGPASMHTALSTHIIRIYGRQLINVPSRPGNRIASMWGPGAKINNDGAERSSALN